MQFSLIKNVLIFLYIKEIISFEKDNNDYHSGKFILYLNNTFHDSFNIKIHPILNYQYLLKLNFTFENKNSKFSYNDKSLQINFTNKKNNDFNIYFFDNEDDIIDLILNKPIDSILSFNYLIFTPTNISQNIGESLSYQIFSIDNIDYISIIDFIKKYCNNNSSISINIFYDNTPNLIPSNYIDISKKIPFYSIIILLLINKIFFNKNKYYNLCFNSSILRIIFSIIYILIIKEKVKYNKNKFKYLTGLPIDSYIDSINRLINDIYISFIFTSMLFINNNEQSIINFFNINDRKIKIYFCVFLFLSLINIPNYLFNQSNDINLIDIIYLKIKIIVYELLKAFLFIYFIKKQINIISKVLFFYSVYHITNNLKCMIFKKMCYKNIRFFFISFTFINIYLNKVNFKKYKNNLYYWDIIDKSLDENVNSFIIFFFWLLLNISEENNPLLLILFKKRNDGLKNFNMYKYEYKNEITKANYLKNKSNINISIYNKYPLIILSPYIEKINNKNIDEISVGTIN